MAAEDVQQRPLDANGLRVKNLPVPAAATDATRATSDLPQPVAPAASLGASFEAARADHEHEGVHSVNGQVGDVTVQGAILTWGDNSIGAGADTRYLTPGRSIATAPLTPGVYQLPLSRSGTARRLIVRHNTAAGNGNVVVYTLLLNGAPTALTVTVPSGAVAQAIDLVNAAAVVVGDRLELQATKALAIASSGLDVQASVEIS